MQDAVEKRVYHFFGRSFFFPSITWFTGKNSITSLPFIPCNHPSLLLHPKHVYACTSSRVVVGTKITAHSVSKSQECSELDAERVIDMVMQRQTARTRK